MLKKEITFPSYFEDDEEITETFYFNLNKVEITELAISEQGGLGEWIQAIVSSRDERQILTKFKEIVQKAYGVRSLDGRRFIKTPEVWLEFEQSPAFDKLFFELMTDATAASAFIVGIVPSDLAAKAEVKDVVTAKVLEKKGVEEYSDDELLKMPEDQFDKLVGRDPKKWPQRVLMIAFRRKTDS